MNRRKQKFGGKVCLKLATKLFLFLVLFSSAEGDSSDERGRDLTSLSGSDGKNVFRVTNSAESKDGWTVVEIPNPSTPEGAVRIA